MAPPPPASHPGPGTPSGTVAGQSPFAASAPVTRASPCIFHNGPLWGEHGISRRSWSPGRNRAGGTDRCRSPGGSRPNPLPAPPSALGRGSPPGLARGPPRSVRPHDGMTGKCPWKYGSLIVTFDAGRSAFPGSKLHDPGPRARNGYRCGNSLHDLPGSGTPPLLPFCGFPALQPGDPPEEAPAAPAGVSNHFQPVPVGHPRGRPTTPAVLLRREGAGHARVLAAEHHPVPTSMCPRQPRLPADHQPGPDPGALSPRFPPGRRSPCPRPALHVLSPPGSGCPAWSRDRRG